MFASALVCLLAGLRKKTINQFSQKNQWKGGTWATEEKLDFGGNPDHVTLRLGKLPLGGAGAPPCFAREDV